jgi:uncharacterized coiled-coil DUF342 family protein
MHLGVLVKLADEMQKQSDDLHIQNLKLSRQLDDALDGIAELKDKIRQLEQLNEELRSLPVPRRTG